MNKDISCPCGENCTCNPCSCHSDTSACCSKMGSCHRGHGFWFWASIRILVVVGMIIGAFELGARSGGFGHSEYRRYEMEDNGGSLRKRGMMESRNTSGTDQPDQDAIIEHCKLMPNMPMCARYGTKNATSMTGDMMGMSMLDMTAMLKGKTGDELDRAFLEGMIPHHQGAVDMAAYLTGARHPELQKMGLDIIAAQTKEIEQMKKWMQDWGYDTNTGTVNTGSIQ